MIVKGVKGESRLWEVYWIGGIATYFFIWLLLYLGAKAWQSGYDHQTTLLVAGIPTLVISAWWTVAVWQCAPNCNHKAWTWAARIVVALNTVKTLRHIF